MRDAAKDCSARYTLDGVPFLGISVRAVLPDVPLRHILVARFSRFAKVYVPTVGDIIESGFQLWPTFRSADHFDVQLHSAAPAELAALLVAFGQEMDNPAWFGN